MKSQEDHLVQLGLSAHPDRREELKERIRARALPAVLSRRSGRRPARRRVPAGLRWPLIGLPIAAAILLAVLWRPTAPPAVKAVATSEVREYATGAGERMQLMLEDGTSVVLGARSRIHVHGGSASATREVVLDGIAFFEVAHDPDRPFLVHAGRTTTRVLGTKFVVRGFEDEASVGVAVASGRVAVLPDASADRSAVVLDPGQIGKVRDDGLFEVADDAARVDRLLDWAEGPLRFEHRALMEILQDLEGWYPVHFEVPDPALAAQPLTLPVRGERLTDVLAVIEAALGVTCARHGDTVTIHRR